MCFHEAVMSLFCLHWPCSRCAFRIQRCHHFVFTNHGHDVFLGHVNVINLCSLCSRSTFCVFRTRWCHQSVFTIIVCVFQTGLRGHSAFTMLMITVCVFWTKWCHHSVLTVFTITVCVFSGGMSLSSVAIHQTRQPWCRCERSTVCPSRCWDPSFHRLTYVTQRWPSPTSCRLVSTDRDHGEFSG